MRCSMGSCDRGPEGKGKREGDIFFKYAESITDGFGNVYRETKFIDKEGLRRDWTKGGTAIRFTKPLRSK